MRLTRLIAGAISASLLGLVPVALTAGTANAADYTTVTTLEASRNLIEHKSGYSPFISGTVKDSAGNSVYAGTVDLLAKPNGAKWRKVATKDASGYLSFSDVKPKKNTQYRLVYNGGSNSSNTYQPSNSRTIKIRVARKFTLKRTNNYRVFVYKGRVTPKYNKKRLVVKASKKEKKGFKKVKGLQVKTNKKGKVTLRLPKRKGKWWWTVTAKGDKNYAANGYKIWTRVS